MAAFEDSFINFITQLRGGLPDECDFCSQPFTAERQPVPEEGGEWACTECEQRWSKEP